MPFHLIYVVYHFWKTNIHHSFFYIGCYSLFLPHHVPSMNTRMLAIYALSWQINILILCKIRFKFVHWQEESCYRYLIYIIDLYLCMLIILAANIMLPFPWQTLFNHLNFQTHRALIYIQQYNTWRGVMPGILIYKCSVFENAHILTDQLNWWQ